ncbi:anaphase-promoting complex subunit 2 [Holotrichia oblita]|uniref:Anaphase-promoting complex subunit 2 n=1 Tax=Holotrichia oblita TaxID=644536 RepID=A0ACB9TW18_HOLOL|nr:anaphase-promoting complex subunit 2 [Holotrichia oblita]
MSGRQLKRKTTIKQSGDESDKIANSSYVTIINNSESKPVSTDVLGRNEFYQVIEIIKKLNLMDTIHDLIIKNVEKYVCNTVVVECWMCITGSNSEAENFQNFHKAMVTLYNYYLLLLSALLSQLPLDYKKSVRHFYEVGLKYEENRGTESSDELCSNCGSNSNCICAQYFYEANSILLELGLLEPLASQILTTTIYDYIENHVETTCKDRFDVSFLTPLQKWLEDVIIKWLRKIYTCDYSNKEISKFNKKLINFMYEIYTKVRINQLFGIIIEYPDSISALQDLKTCLSKTDLRPYLTRKLQKSMETRLLHTGVSTPDILTAYVATIRSMRVLDPSGLLLGTITQPIHQYLRSRDDTVRCVVSSLTEEGPSDLADELIKGEALQTDENTPSDDEEINWENWLPDPVDADPNKPLANNRRTSDIISMLVNVYGSRELFVNEYRTLLADRLLTSLTCDTEREIRYLELLKLRFGDAQLHYCEVMLKDIVDSKRITQNIKHDLSSSGENDIPISSMILSAQFWPAFKEEKCELHPNVDEQMKKYTACFETLKGNRTLYWKKHLGLVDLDIELPDRTMNLYSVTPIHATIILHFQDKSQWHLDELSRIMQVPPTVLRRKIGFWESQYLITQVSPDIFQLVEISAKGNLNVLREIIVEDESESAMASTQDQREEELQTFWSYVTGMLMNLDSLPLERIHQVLKMFAFQGPTTECSLQELKHFLDRKVREHQLVYSNGYYKLPKS